MTMRARAVAVQRLTAFGAAAVAVLVLLTGCASLPDSSAPQAVGTIEHEPSVEGPPAPALGRDPDLLLHDFLQATADPADRHAAARQYLAPETASQWDDATSTTIVDKPDTLRESRTADHATYRIRARKVGELAADGGYRASDDIVEDKIEMTKIGGEWRIDQIADGVLMDSAAFAKFYQRYPLYFTDPSGSTVVPDLRWVSAPKADLAQRLLDMLAAGPQSALAPVVRNELAAPVEVRGQITKFNGDPNGVGVGLGGVRIDLGGVANLPPHDKDLLAAQVLFTLSGADILGPYQLLADGKPLAQRFADTGWSIGDVAPFGPTSVAQNRIGLHALRGGGLVEVGDNGPTNPSGYFGAVNNLESAALSPDGKLVAAVANAGRPEPQPQRTLMIGTYGGSAFPVDQGSTISRPSWSGDNSAAWAVIDGQRVIRAVLDRTGTVSVQDVDTSGLLDGSSGVLARTPITEVRVSRSGVRAAVIADGKVYVAVVIRQADGKFALASPVPVGVGLSTPAVSVSWFGSDTLLIAREGNVDPVSAVSLDGSQPTPQTSRNLTAPVRTVSASPDHQYVADSRAVLELTSNPEGGESYWREVPGLGSNAVPVLPG
ncbi:MtrAB system accessory lipoprotein LpqB [Nocardia callitridis]|uniref:Lipoprotein LpqB n=1 Tax=Nocardia callitridis TaxID=648753 RepID=A0ABP9JU41_9NOCA